MLWVQAVQCGGVFDFQTASYYDTERPSENASVNALGRFDVFHAQRLGVYRFIGQGIGI